MVSVIDREAVLETVLEKKNTSGIYSVFHTEEKHYKEKDGTAGGVRGSVRRVRGRCSGGQW